MTIPPDSPSRNDAGRIPVYWVVATNTTDIRYAEAHAASEADAMDRARGLSAGNPGVSFGVYAVRDGEGAFLVASFFNGERRFEAAS